MTWNWQQKAWPHFYWSSEPLAELERQFLFKSGILVGTTNHLSESDKVAMIVEMISDEAVKTSEIEGEYLNRASVQSSIRRNFGLDTDTGHISPVEQGIAEMFVDLYHNFAEPLSHTTLYHWHNMLMSGRRKLTDIGRYRTHEDPMQVVSGLDHRPTIHFEAPPSSEMEREMNDFISWFNATSPDGAAPLSALTRAGVAHLYFVCVHPFEDGNGRIGRAIAEKALSQCLGQPTLIALARTIQSKRKVYYDMLGASNKEMEITDWLLYFAETALDAQTRAQDTINFLIEKTKFYDKLSGQLNGRQAKVIERMFREGLDGFKGA